MCSLSSLLLAAKRFEDWAEFTALARLKDPQQERAGQGVDERAKREGDRQRPRFLASIFERENIAGLEVT